MDTLGFQFFSLKIGLFRKNDPPGGYRAGSHHVTRQFLKELPLGDLKKLVPDCPKGGAHWPPVAPPLI